MCSNGQLYRSRERGVDVVHCPQNQSRQCINNTADHLKLWASLGAGCMQVRRPCQMCRIAASVTRRCIGMTKGKCQRLSFVCATSAITSAAALPLCCCAGAPCLQNSRVCAGTSIAHALRCAPVPSCCAWSMLVSVFGLLQRRAGSTYGSGNHRVRKPTCTERRGHELTQPDHVRTSDESFDTT
jgi:hypothetical protein